MIRSMWSAVSGLRNHQIFLDVTGNNIANVNTHGYKAGRAIFEDSLSQMVRGASAPVQGTGVAGTGVGGTNPAQIGLGVRLGAVTNVFTQGGAQVTNLTTDVAIQGDGFFQVKKGDVTFYTRNGAFNFDSDGFLVTSDGSYVMGTQYNAGTYTAATGASPAALTGNIENTTTTAADGRLRLPRALATATPAMVGWGGLASGTVPVSLQSFQITPDGKLVGTFTDDSRRVFGQIDIATFNNPPGLEKVGGSLYNQTNNSGNAISGHPRSADRGSLMSGTLEMSNVDLAAEFTNLIVAQRGFQANSKVITASDEVLQDLVNMKR